MVLLFTMWRYKTVTIVSNLNFQNIYQFVKAKYKKKTKVK